MEILLLWERLNLWQNPKATWDVFFNQKNLMPHTRGFAFTRVVSHKTGIHTRYWKLLLGVCAIAVYRIIKQVENWLDHEKRTAKAI